MGNSFKKTCKKLWMFIAVMVVGGIISATLIGSVKACDGLDKSFGEITFEEAAPVEETPAEEIPAEEPPVEDTPVVEEEVPAEEIPAEEPQIVYVDREVEVIKEVPVEVVKEVEVPVETIVEVEKEVPVYVDREVEVIKEVPVEVVKEVEVPVETIIEVEKEVPVEVIKEILVEKEVPVETIVEVEKEIEIIVEKEVPVEVEVIREILVEKEIPVEVEKEVIKYITETPSNENTTSASSDEPTSEDSSVNDQVVSETVVPETKVEEATPVATPAVATTEVAPEKPATGAAQANAKSTNAVKGVSRKPLTVKVSAPAEAPVEPVVTSVETDEAGRFNFLPLLWILLGLFASLLVFLFFFQKKYVVAKNVVTEDGRVEKVQLERFFSIEKACEYLRDLQYEGEEEYVSLNILNNSRKETNYKLEDGTVINENIIYVVSADKETSAVIFADDHEYDAVCRILGFVQDEVKATA